MPPWRRSRRPTASWPASTTPTPTPATSRPPPGSGRSPKPTKPSPTPSRRAAYDRAHGPFTGTRLATPSHDRAASLLIQVLEEVWQAIRARHGEIPAVVIILASGTETRQPRWGHFASGRWNVGNDQRAEVMISGEALRLTPPEVLAVILHEAAHALACARGIKDTSRQGRYHNKHFKTHAGQLGLAVEHDQRHGWSASKITGDTETAYARQLDALAERHDAVAARRNHHRPHHPAQLEPHRGGLPVRALHPRRRLHPGRGPHHLPGLRPGLPGQEPGRRLSARSRHRLDHAHSSRSSHRARSESLPTWHGAGPCLPRQPGPCQSCPSRERTRTPMQSSSTLPSTRRIPTLDGARSRGIYVQFYDPDGRRYGIPTYPYHWAPKHLYTTRQLRARGLRPGGQAPTAQILWRRGLRVAYLYRADLALPKTAGHPRPARRDRQGAPRPAHLPHLRRSKSPTTSPAPSANAPTAPTRR